MSDFIVQGFDFSKPEQAGRDLCASSASRLLAHVIDEMEPEPRRLLLAGFATELATFVGTTLGAHVAEDIFHKARAQIRDGIELARGAAH